MPEFDTFLYFEGLSGGEYSFNERYLFWHEWLLMPFSHLLFWISAQAIRAGLNPVIDVRVTYLDDNMRITRTPDDLMFIYTRVAA